MTASHTANSSTVLVTGGTEGLGRATALLLAGEGFRVFAGGRNAQRRAALDAEAQKRKLPLSTLEMDVADDDSVNRAISEIEQLAGPVEILINNAGIAIAATMEDISLADLHKIFETNYFGVVRVTQRVLPAMRERRRGRIINLSSVAGKFATPIFGPYSSTKHAVEAMSDALRIELLPFGIYVAIIEPGYIPSNMEATATELSSAYVERAESSPYQMVYRGFRSSWGRVTANPKYKPEDCARVILQAIRDTPPRPRYLVTASAHVVKWMRRLLPDRTLDRMVAKDHGLKAPDRNS